MITKERLQELMENAEQKALLYKEGSFERGYYTGKTDLLFALLQEVEGK